jgi:hypothetical protein
MRNPLKRWPVLLALLVAVVAVAIGLVCLPYGSQVTWVNGLRIKEGMTFADVRAILGKPWDDSLLDPDPPAHRELIWSSEPKTGPRCMWVGSDFYVLVYFDSNNKVETREVVGVGLSPDVLPHSSVPAGVWRRLRARLGW